MINTLQNYHIKNNFQLKKYIYLYTLYNYTAIDLNQKNSISDRSLICWCYICTVNDEDKVEVILMKSKPQLWWKKNRNIL